MSKSKLEYIWLDGHQPTQNMRSKTKVEDNLNNFHNVNPLTAHSNEEQNNLQQDNA